MGEYLNRTFDNVELPAEFAQGSIPEAVTKLELPFKVVDAKTRKTVASIEWTSSNAKVAKVVSSYNAASVSFTHPAAPADVVLTATIKMAGTSGLSEKTVAVERPFRSSRDPTPRSSRLSASCPLCSPRPKSA